MQIIEIYGSTHREVLRFLFVMLRYMLLYGTSNIKILIEYVSVSQWPSGIVVACGTSGRGFEYHPEPAFLKSLSCAQVTAMSVAIESLSHCFIFFLFNICSLGGPIC